MSGQTKPTLLGELFRIAFERRASFDTARREARPWLYGIASNLLAKHRRREARRLQATARLMRRTTTPADPFDDVDARIDATDLWTRIAAAIATLPPGERDALLLFAWEDLPTTWKSTTGTSTSPSPTSELARNRPGDPI